MTVFENIKYALFFWFICVHGEYSADAGHLDTEMIQKMSVFENIKYALFSGLFASTASTFGKLSGLSVFEGIFYLRVVFFMGMLSCNGAVWTFFVKALQRTNSLTATVISSATNYVFSALAGFCIFDEVTSLLWWSGMFSIVTGLLLITAGEAKNNVSKTI
ncbi:transmembrane protein 42 isoform X2 [Leptinotarsa decemlineata]|uniref:transmembrane protein 42 isoform X2 n=1 Tax=Leptinotarsa decemlineata TaxID=7539 RepID=UPI000C253331|nr:uncharacterized protein LOC111503556 isoform X2 [Leptinotarsa decemlineata]